MRKFIYKTVFTDTKGILGGKVNAVDFETQLNELGWDGWELVSTVASNM